MFFRFRHLGSRFGQIVIPGGGECVLARRQVDLCAILDQGVQGERGLLAVTEDLVVDLVLLGIGHGHVSVGAPAFVRMTSFTRTGAAASKQPAYKKVIKRNTLTTGEYRSTPTL